MPRHEEFDDLLIGGNAAATDADLSTKADQSEVDSLSTTVDSKADQDGGGTATLTNYSNVNTNQLNSGGPVTDGDGTERQIWLIAAGASDPAGAGPEDLIFEEQA